jgi:transposase-like protein
MERRFLEEQLGAGRSLEQIGRLVGKDPSTVGYWVKKHGLVAAHSAKHAPKGGLSRPVLEGEIESGASIRGIAIAHGVSEATVKHWLRKFGLQTSRAARMQSSEAAHRSQKEVVEIRCLHHGPSPHVLEGRGSFRCTKCRAEWVAARRRRVKAILVREAGGRCSLCGYDRYVGALQFHHLDPAEKSFSLARGGVTRSLEKAREEAAKCALVCANCHAELEAGVATLQEAGPPSDVACW